MAEPFLAEIRIFPYSFAPKDWAFCNGQIMPIAQNTALFSLLGTTYGGNGTTTYALPNLQGSLPMGAGAGNGLTPRDLGETGGTATVTIATGEMPSHTHTMQSSDSRLAPANVSKPNRQVVFARATDTLPYQPAATQPLTAMAPQVVSTTTRGGQPHTNVQPFAVTNFCIALRGIFPQRP
jgi:microcystin-dependent protein